MGMLLLLSFRWVSWDVGSKGDSDMSAIPSACGNDVDILFWHEKSMLLYFTISVKRNSRRIERRIEVLPVRSLNNSDSSLERETS